MSQEKHASGAKHLDSRHVQPSIQTRPSFHCCSGSDTGQKLTILIVLYLYAAKRNWVSISECHPLIPSFFHGYWRRQSAWLPQICWSPRAAWHGASISTSLLLIIQETSGTPPLLQCWQHWRLFLYQQQVWILTLERFLWIQPPALPCPCTADQSLSPLASFLPLSLEQRRAC